MSHTGLWNRTRPSSADLRLLPERRSNLLPAALPPPAPVHTRSLEAINTRIPPSQGIRALIRTRPAEKSECPIFRPRKEGDYRTVRFLHF